MPSAELRGFDLETALRRSSERAFSKSTEEHTDTITDAEGVTNTDRGNLRAEARFTCAGRAMSLRTNCDAEVCGGQPGPRWYYQLILAC
jgi:hypothetical protein